MAENVTYESIESLEDERLSKPGEPVPTTDLFGNAPDSPPTTLHATGNYYFLLPHRQLTPDEVPLVETALQEIARLTQPIDIDTKGYQKPARVPASLTAPSGNFPANVGIAPDPAPSSDLQADQSYSVENREINIADPGQRRAELDKAQQEAVAAAKGDETGKTDPDSKPDDKAGTSDKDKEPKK